MKKLVLVLLTLISLSSYAIGHTIEVVGGANEGSYNLTSLPTTIIGATSVQIGGVNSWNNAQITIFKTAIAGSKTTLISADMGDVELSEVTTAFDNMFDGFFNLRTVLLPSSITTIGTKCFYGTAALESITIPASVVTIGVDAFRGSGLKHIDIPKTVATIGQSSFRECANLKTANIACSGEIIANEHTTKIDYFAFYQAPALEKVYIGNQSSQDLNHTINIYPRAFFDCNRLKSLHFGGAAIKTNIQRLNYYKYGEDYRDRTFENCDSLADIHFGNGEVYIGTAAFKDCEMLKNLHLTSAVKYVSRAAFSSMRALQRITMDDGLAIIGEEAFRDNMNLDSVQLSNTITSIGKNSFANDASLERIAFPSSVKVIDTCAFYASGLTRISIPKTVSIVGESSFQACPHLKLVNIGNGDTVYIGTTEIREKAFYQAPALEILNIGTEVCPDDKHSITTGTKVFYQCPKLKTLNIGNLNGFSLDHTISLSAHLFYECNSLKTINFGNSRIITNLRDESNYGLSGQHDAYNDRTFMGCDSLEQINFNDGAYYIGTDVFRDCPRISSLNLPKSVAWIGKAAFYNLDKLTSLSIGVDGKGTSQTSAPTISTFAFDHCDVLESVEFGPAIRTISYCAFRNCPALKSLTLPNSLTTIGECAFQNAISLESVFIPKSVSTLGANAFDGCASIDTVQSLSISPSACTAWNAAHHSETKLYVPSQAIPTYSELDTWKVMTIGDSVPKLTFYSNGGVGNMDHQYFFHNKKMPLAANEFIHTDGNKFLGWGYSASQRHPNLNDGDSLSISINDTLYAIWEMEVELLVEYGAEHTLSKDNSVYEKIVVEDNATLVVDANIGTEKLTLKSGTATYYNLVLNESMSTQELQVTKEINNAYWYFFSVPFDIAITDVEAQNPHIGAYGEGWLMKEYSEPNRADAQFGNTWIYLDKADTLFAHKGYLVATSNRQMKEMNFIHTYGAPTPLIEGITVDVVASTAGQNTDVGWNIISVPYFQKGKYQAVYTNGETSHELYVNTPINHGLGHYSQNLSSEYEFSPSESFFVQVPNDGTVEFIPANEVGGGGITKDYYIVEIADTAADKTAYKASLFFEESAPRDEYYIMYDLEKMTTYKDNLCVYFPDHDTRLVYSAINPADYAEVPVGVFLPKKGTYELRTTFPRVDMVLYDVLLDVEVNASVYQFTSNSDGHIDDRFVLRFVPIPTPISTVDSNTWQAIGQTSTIQIHNAVLGKEVLVVSEIGCVVAKQVSETSQFETINLPAGVYVVCHDGSSQKVVVH